METNKQTFQIQSFDLNDDKWLDFLKQHGVVIIKKVLKQQETDKAISLFWRWIENLKSGVEEKDPETWVNRNWPGIPDMGFFTGYGGAHSQASWYVRTRPPIKQAFSKIWKTDDLIVSFDTFIAWRPWWRNKSWKPFVERLHLDQNPSYKRGFHCVQGMVPLYDVNECGGLMVVPNTNNDKTQDEISSRYNSIFGGDFLQLNPTDPYVKEKRGILVKCQAGDLILWDSRTIHGGLILQPSEQFKEKNENKLTRLSLTVTMMPKSSASEEVMEQRRKAFEKRIALTHWANEFNKSGMAVMVEGIKHDKINFEEVQKSKEVLDLIG